MIKNKIKNIKNWLESDGAIVTVKLKALKYNANANYKAVEVDYKNDEQISIWCNICNSAYSDSHYSPEEGKAFLHNHPVMCDNKTFLFYDALGNPVATVSYGKYRANVHIGGLFRIAVMPQYQGKGIGAYVIAYGCTCLQKTDVSCIEDIITYKRHKSLRLHYRLGFIPQRTKNCPVPVYSHSFKTRALLLLLDFLMIKDKCLAKRA